MSDLKSKMEAMLFNYQTVNRTDFRGGEILPPTFTKYKEKPQCVRIRPPPLKDHHTLSAWRTTGVPFNLMHWNKPITRTDPTKVQEAYVKPPDEEKAESVRTRPRLVMTPAVSMDDITNPRTRQILCDYMYTSNMTKATMEAISDYFSVKAPLPGLPAPANPIKLPPLTLPYVSPEWRMESIPWDLKQLRSHCDSTKEFWLAQELPPGRQLIIDNFYSTTTNSALKQAVAKANYKNVKAPLPKTYSKSRPVYLELLKEPYVSPEWRMDTASWDSKQLRASIEPTKRFWLTREDPFCSVCEDTAMRAAKNKTRL